MNGGTQTIEKIKREAEEIGEKEGQRCRERGTKKERKRDKEGEQEGQRRRERGVRGKRVGITEKRGTAWDIALLSFKRLIHHDEGFVHFSI